MLCNILPVTSAALRVPPHCCTLSIFPLLFATSFSLFLFADSILPRMSSRHRHSGDHCRQCLQCRLQRPASICCCTNITIKFSLTTIFFSFQAVPHLCCSFSSSPNLFFCATVILFHFRPAFGPSSSRFEPFSSSPNLFCATACAFASVIPFFAHCSPHSSPSLFRFPG